MSVVKQWRACLQVLSWPAAVLAFVAGISTACGQSEQKLDEHLIAVGWVQAAGEVRIYARKEDLGKLYDGSCISGAMMYGRTMHARLQNQYVSVYGTFLDVEKLHEMTLQGISIGVENYCNSSKIAIITRIEKR